VRRGSALFASSLAVAVCWAPAPATAVEATATGLRGDPEAIAEAQAMVDTMGGRELWSRLGSLHFVHRWTFRSRIDSYLENEILDLTGPRSWIDMKSEIYHRVRVYSPEHGYWNVIDGTLSIAAPEEARALVEGAPFHFTRIARGIATGDPFYEVRLGDSEYGGKQLDFLGPDGHRGAWIVLNARKEPLIWGVERSNPPPGEPRGYSYSFGPMEPYGNLRMPKWGVTGRGLVYYQMISLTGDTAPPDAALFIPPEQEGQGRSE